MFVRINQIGRDTLFLSKRSHAFDDRNRGRKLSELPEFNDKTHGKIKKTVGALNIPCRTEADGRNTTRLHAVGRSVFFMNLAVRAKHGPTMVFDIEFVMEDNFARAEPIRDTIAHWEIIKPHDNMVEKMDEHDLWEVGIGEGTQDSSTTIFDDTNPAFDVANVFRSSRCVEDGMQDMILDLIKFVVH